MFGPGSAFAINFVARFNYEYEDNDKIKKNG